MKYRKLAPVLAAGVLALLAGCNNTSADQDSDQPPPAAPAATSAAPSAPAAAPPAAPGPVVGLRPLSPAQKQQRDFCQQNIVKNGCEFYSDDSLKLQGFDPDS